MAINTENKRRSTIAMGIPGMAVYPIPDNLINVNDRRHTNEMYSGLETLVDTFFFWRKDGDSSLTSWSSDGRASNSWVQDADGSSTWVKQKEVVDE